MKLKWQKDYIAIYSPRLTNWIGYLSGVSNAKAFASFPIIGFKDSSWETPRIVNHERIHFRQEIELLFVGLWILKYIELIILWFNYDRLTAYKLSAFEQEAYLNQDNPNYLKQRKPYSFIKYFKNKQMFAFDPSEPGKITL